jgi:hypothetical protein
MDPIRASEAFERVAATISQTATIEVRGVFKGVLLESWKFDFLDEHGHKISGKVQEDLTADQVAALSSDFFNQQCIAELEKTTVLFRNGRERTTHVLIDLRPIE